jgi:murein DD-endopeptidase MepM/ murein hydrolase activator NlpD
MAKHDPNVLADALRAFRDFGATPRERKADIEAGLVESGLQALQGGDRDSTGYLQQRPSQGWGPVGESAYKDTLQFLRAARKLTSQGFKGSAGALAQAVQRSAFPARYDQRAGDAESLLGGTGGDIAGGRGPTRAGAAATGQATPWDLSGGGGDSAAFLSALLKPQQPVIQSSGVQDPSFSARSNIRMPQGYQAPAAGGGPVAKGASIDDALALVSSLQGASLPDAQTQGGGSGGTQAGVTSEASPRASGGRFSGRLPVGKAGKVIGTPYAGTHNLGNWQSDNAVDIAVPVGTPMVALQDGVVLKVRHHPQGAGRFAGDQITIRGANGNEYFYAHGVADVKAGQRIRKGQELGTTGSANGVAHLHFGQMKGDPRQHT